MKRHNNERHWNDLSDQASALMQALLSQPANPLGLHAFVDDFKRKAENLTHALADGRPRAIQGVVRKLPGGAPIGR